MILSLFSVTLSARKLNFLSSRNKKRWWYIGFHGVSMHDGTKLR